MEADSTAGFLSLAPWLMANVYQNTVVMTSGSGPPPPALRLGATVHGITVRNNIFAVDSGAIVSDTQAVPMTAAVLQGNDYYSATGPWSIEWGATAYHSLASWRTATSEETVAGQKTGGTVNPDLTGPVLGLQHGRGDQPARRGKRLCSPRWLTIARCGACPRTLRTETQICQLRRETDVGSASECRSTVALNRKNLAMGGH